MPHLIKIVIENAFGQSQGGLAGATAYPIVILGPPPAPPIATGVVLTDVSEFSTDGSYIPIIRVNFNFGSYTAASQRARIYIKGPSSTEPPDSDYTQVGVVAPDTGGHGRIDIRGVGGGHFWIRIITENQYGFNYEPLNIHPFEDIEILNPVATLADIPHGFGFFEYPGVFGFPTRWEWEEHPDHNRLAYYELYGNLTGGTPEDPFGIPTYITGGTPDGLIYRGPSIIGTLPRGLAVTGPGYVRAVDRHGNVSRWFGSAIQVSYSGSNQLQPVISIDSSTITPNSVLVHIIPDTSINRESIVATRLQIRVKGGSWPSTAYGANGQILVDGLTREILVPWSQPGETVEIRAKFDGYPQSDWSSTLETTIPPIETPSLDFIVAPNGTLSDATRAIQDIISRLVQGGYILDAPFSPIGFATFTGEDDV